MRRFLRTVLLVVAIGCLVAFFTFGAESSATGTRQTSRMFVGQPWPWFESRIEQEVKPGGAQSGSGESGVIVRSPAWFLLAGAVIGLLTFRRLGPPRPKVALA